LARPGLKDCDRMTENNSSNGINTFIPTDEMASFLNQKVIVNTNWLNRPLFGIITEVGPSFISLTKKDGRIVKIRRASVMGIEEMKPEAVQ
jgi:hypothetical protein